MSLSVGDKAPEFTLPNAKDEQVRLGDLLKDRGVVLYFYPKDETPGCIAEACSFNDNLQGFDKYGYRVVGISKDSIGSHGKFANHYHLNFTLLSDKHNEVRKLYGVTNVFLGLIPGRKTFIIDKQSIIRYIFDYQLKATLHITEAIKALSHEQ